MDGNRMHRSFYKWLRITKSTRNASTMAMCTTILPTILVENWNHTTLAFWDMIWCGNPEKKLQIVQKYDPSHHDFVAWGHFRFSKSWNLPKIGQNMASWRSTKIWPILWVLHLIAPLKWPQTIKSWWEGSYFWQICNVFFRVPKICRSWFPYLRRLTCYDFNFPPEL